MLYAHPCGTKSFHFSPHPWAPHDLPPRKKGPVRRGRAAFSPRPSCHCSDQLHTRSGVPCVLDQTGQTAASGDGISVPVFPGVEAERTGTKNWPWGWGGHLGVRGGDIWCVLPSQEVSSLLRVCTSSWMSSALLFLREMLSFSRVAAIFPFFRGFHIGWSAAFRSAGQWDSQHPRGD